MASGSMYGISLLTMYQGYSWCIPPLSSYDSTKQCSCSISLRYSTYLPKSSQKSHSSSSTFAYSPSVSFDTSRLHALQRLACMALYSYSSLPSNAVLCIRFGIQMQHLLHVVSIKLHSSLLGEYRASIKMLWSYFYQYLTSSPCKSELGSV